MNIKKRLIQSWTYFQKGYSLYLALPIGLLSMATSVYYLAIKGLPFLQDIFPHFYNFLLVFMIIYPVGAFIGWWHFKKSTVFENEQEIMTLSNPYTREKIVPISIPTWKLFQYQAKQAGLDDIAAQMQKIIEKSSEGLH